MERSLIAHLKLGERNKVQGFVENIRNKRTMAFLVLRDYTGRVQLTIEKEKYPEVAAIVDQLTVESVITAEGMAVENSYVKLGGVEILPDTMKIESIAEPLPISKDAAIDSRLDYRWIDLRSDRNTLIFKAQTELVAAMREFLLERSFMEIHTPKLIAAASESGSDVFELKYFDRKAYLSQSPQFYKQMAMAAGFDRIFEVGPVFRAEKSFTNKHATEFTGFDLEMSYITSFRDVMAIEAELLQAALKRVKEKYGEQIKELYGLETVVPTLPFPEMNISIITWASTKMLQKGWHRQVFIWLPLGLVIGLLAAMFVLRILRRIQSPHHRLQDAIENRDICVHYQPIVSLANGKIVGAEALARWPQTDGSWLSPDSFIPLAQQTGLSEPLTLLIIRSVFEDMGDWLRQHPQQHISINLESTVLTSEKIPQLLREMINHYQVNPRQIALELTEREFADPKTSAPIISRYREAGHEIYLDDFGTGYSSLSYLQDLDVDILKIDKSFVDALEYKNVTPHIIEMAKTLKLKMVAEGIETSKQEEWLRQHGVHYGQGWLYSKALPKEDFLRWAEQHL